MTINIKIINEDTVATRSVLVTAVENGVVGTPHRIPAGGEYDVCVHSTKDLRIEELQHYESPDEKKSADA